jgi:uncharacterized iron-regulated membrane protein
MNGFDIPREPREAGEEAMEDRLRREQTQTENELLCEKLLGWIKHEYRDDSLAWEMPPKAGEYQPTIFYTPSFTTWSDAGLILDALFDVHRRAYPDESVTKLTIEWDRSKCSTLPTGVRAAALEYIRSQS